MGKILVVDDEKSLRVTLQAFLTKDGHEVETAEDAEMAKKLLSNHKFDVVITDIILPKVPGVDLLKIIRDTDPDVQVIMMTGEPTVESATASLRAGAFDYLYKPISKATVLATVRNALDTKAIDDEKKQVDQQNRMYQELLEHLVEERTAELKKTHAQLLHAQKMEALGTLAGGIAHDFNNILAVIIGFSEIVIDELSDNPELKDDVKEIHIAGQRAKSLVRQILTFARKTDTERKPLQASLFIKEGLKMLRATIQTTIEIKPKIESKALIMGDPVHLNQIIMNLCTNAAHAMEDEGGVLEVSLTQEEIKTPLVSRGVRLPVGKYLKLAISDTGTGISPKVIDSIFEPYFSTKQIGEGTGLGLSVVHGIVTSYNGLITVDSEFNIGSTFTVFLPVLKQTSEQIELEEKELPTGNEKILFVDDEASITKMADKMLARLGYQITTCQNGPEAIALIKSNPTAFDLAITDMTMPGMTGDKLAQELMNIRSDIPVIVCTGYSKKISEESILEIGVKALVMKPFKKDILAHTIRDVLDNAQK
jgi:signal transduction histidine kinase